MRRASLFQATPKLQRRLQVRKLFDAIDHDGSGTVSQSELQESLATDATLSEFISRKHPSGSSSDLFRDIDEDHNEEISWNEFLNFVTKLEANPDYNTDADFDKFFRQSRAASMECAGNLEALIEGQGDGANESYVQDVAMEINFHDGGVFVEFMEVHDTRVDLEPENKVILGSTTDCVKVATEFVKSSKVGYKWLPTITREVQKGVIYACKRSIDVMHDARGEIDELYITAGRRVLDNENEFLRAVDNWMEERELKVLRAEEDREKKEAEKARKEKEEVEQAAAAAEGDDFNTEEVIEFLQNRSPVTMATLNAELNVLRMELQQHKTREEERKQRIDAANGGGGEEGKQGEEKSAFAKVDADGDGRISRDEWRDWADAEIKFMSSANEERGKIIMENRRLRTALTNPSESQKESRLRQQDAEMAVLQEQIVLQQLINENLKSELKISSLSDTHHPRGRGDTVHFVGKGY